MTAAYAEIAERLEKCSGPSYALDVAIANACKLYDSPPLPYTASIDAALTLIVFPWSRSVDATAPMMGIEVCLHGPNGAVIIADHVSEPIATCIAALKVRAAIAAAGEKE